MNEEISFRHWLLATENGTIAGSGQAGAGVQQSIEDAIAQAPGGNKVDAAQQALQKTQQTQASGQGTTVKDAITVAAASDKIAKETGEMGVKAMKRKMAKKMKRK